MRSTILIDIGMASVILLSSCGTSSPERSNIEALTGEIQGRERDGVRAVILRRFGPANRNVGSGFRIEQWDIDGGVLTFNPATGPFFTKDAVSRQLLRTNNPVASCLFGSYEMTTLPD